MKNEINDLIRRSILSNETGYCAVLLLPDGNIGITPEYTKETLPLYIAECEKTGAKLLRTITAAQAKELKNKTK